MRSPGLSLLLFMAACGTTAGGGAPRRDAGGSPARSVPDDDAGAHPANPSDAAPPVIDARVAEAADAGWADSSGDAAPVGDASSAGADAGEVRYVFVTSHLYTGDLGGLAGADAKCQGLASAAGLPGSYFAWLSDSSTSAASRMTRRTPYLLVDGTIFIGSWRRFDLLGHPDHALDLTEVGTPAPLGNVAWDVDQGNVPVRTVWSDTGDDGQAITPAADCDGWHSSTARDASWGSADTSGIGWSSGAAADSPGSCALLSPLYCFEQ